MNHFAVQQKLAQHCKSTILQFKKKIVHFPSSSTGPVGRCHTCATGEVDALGHSYFLDFLFLQMTFYMVKLARSRALFSIYCYMKHNRCVSKCHFSFLTDLNCPQDSEGCIMQYTAEMDTRFHLTSSEPFSM